MKRLIFISLFLLFLLPTCKKDEITNPDQLPEWVLLKAKELVPDQKLLKITDITIIEYKGELFYHIYCGIWSCMYCQLFDKHGVHPNWDSSQWNDFSANQKIIKTVPAT